RRSAVAPGGRRRYPSRDRRRRERAASLSRSSLAWTLARLRGGVFRRDGLARLAARLRRQAEIPFEEQEGRGHAELLRFRFIVDPAVLGDQRVLHREHHVGAEVRIARGEDMRDDLLV